MPKININGHVRDMTPDEEAGMERLREEMPVPAPTVDERLEKLQETVDTIKERLGALLGMKS